MCAHGLPPLCCSQIKTRESISYVSLPGEVAQLMMPSAATSVPSMSAKTCRTDQEQCQHHTQHTMSCAH